MTNAERSRRLNCFLVLALCAVIVACDGQEPSPPGGEPPLDPALVAQGKDIFRFDTFGNEVFWTDTARLHEVITSGVSPATALSVGLKVDADALPQELKDALAAGQVNLDDPATTVALLKLDAVLGLKGTVETIGGKDTLVRVGVTCAMCHSRVDNSFAPGIGHRLDGWAATDLNIGAVVALSPAIPDALKSIMRAWGEGRYDPRINQDGINSPIVIPPAYGLRGVAKETYTGEGPVSYWNAYVAVTQMHGQGTFTDSRLGISVHADPDLVTSKLPALAEYQLSLVAPAPPSPPDAAAVLRGQRVFTGQGRCSSCHLPGQHFTDVNDGTLHAPDETGMAPGYAARTTTKQYRTTPLRGLWQHPPYFHDGSAATLEAVVSHYDEVMSLRLSPQQKLDLEAYLKGL